MARNTGKNVIFVILVVAVLSALIYFGSQQFSLVPSGGATIFSVDSVLMEGKDTSSTQWVIALSMNDGAEKVSGVITKDDISNFNLKSVPASSFKIDFELLNPSCQYSVAKESQAVGELYYAFVTEQCIANVCPYNNIGPNDLIKQCTSGAGAKQIPAVSGTNCGRMVDLKALGGSYTKWCYWLPEESNINLPGECKDSTVSRTVTVTNNPASCGRISTDTTTTTLKISEGQTGGDWQVMEVGMVPKYDLYQISSVAEYAYQAKVTVTMDATGEKFSCIIDPITKVCDLGDFGQVKFAGNLVADKTCPVPATNTMLLKDLDTQKFIPVNSGIGSSLSAYLTSLNKVGQMNIDYYTFTAVPIGEVITATTLSSARARCDPAVGNPVFPEVTAMNGLFKKVPTEAPTINYGCSVDANNKYVCKSGGSVVYPLLKLTVKASKVGIFIPQGKPKILGIATTTSDATTPGFKSDIKFNPGVIQDIYVGVQNIGSEDDSFDVSLNCPFPVSQQSGRVAVASGGTATAKLSATGDGLIQTCSIIANSVGFPANRDESTVKVVVNPSCDQYGVSATDQLFTEFGCYALMSSPEIPCTNSQVWVSQIKKCVDKASIATGEQKLALLEQVSKQDCSLQCNGNKDCVLSCLSNGNVKPVCVGQGTMMKLNDYLCNYENQPNLIMPTTLAGKVWIDAPVCKYVCQFGYDGPNCDIINTNTKFTYGNIPPDALFIAGQKQCETCFDGIKNQDETGVDCGGICQVKYGGAYDCNKLRVPDHCFNHIQDAGETGRDCGGGECSSTCSTTVAPTGAVVETTGLLSKDNLAIVITVLIVAVVVGVLALRKKIHKK
jgi:hypothetical protein